MADENIAKWQQRLEDHFSYQGIVGGRLLPLVMEQERLAGDEFITKYKGYRVIADSFLDFFAETLNAAIHARQQVGWPKDHPWYAPCVLAFVTQFRGMRAAEILSMNGYPLDGYALQRNLKDQALLIGGVVMGITSFPALAGTRGVDTLKQWDETTRELVFRNRLKEEVSVFRKMIGASSGLDGEQIAILKRWNRLFNMQVHGAGLTNYREANAWILQGQAPSIGPRIDIDANSVFMNQSNEIAWMTLRILPFLQLADTPFDRTWQEKWGVLDDSFRFTIEGLGKIGKRIAPAFISMIDRNFATSPTTRYVERG
jgi:hypothetical protein